MKKFFFKSAQGVTLIELITTLAVAGILASAFVALAVPQINLFFFLPQRIRVINASSDVLDTIMEGDSIARGLRFAQTITAASANSLTYTYTTADWVSHTLTINYVPASHTVTRSLDAAAATFVPYYLNASSGFLVDALEVNFFRYYTSAGVEMVGGGIVPATIYQVNVAASVKTGSGSVTESEGMMAIKSGVEIKHYGLPEVPDI